MRQRMMASTMAAIAPAKADPIATSAGQVASVLMPECAERAYKGIPLAKTPVGDLRWRPPQPAVPWSGTLWRTGSAPYAR